MRDKSRLRRTALAALLTLAAAGFAVSARAGAGCCMHCGADGCRKVCRLTRTDRKITTTCWGCATEDFCVPGPTRPGCRQCETVCGDDLDTASVCHKPKRLLWTEWQPGTRARVYTKRKLMKRTITKTVPSFKWVVEDLCPECEANCEVVDVPAGARLPPAPHGAADVIIPAQAVQEQDGL